MSAPFFEWSATDGGVVDKQVDFKYDVWGNRIEKSYDADGAGNGAAAVARCGKGVVTFLACLRSGYTQRPVYRSLSPSPFSKEKRSGHADESSLTSLVAKAEDWRCRILHQSSRQNESWSRENGSTEPKLALIMSLVLPPGN